MYCAGTSTPGTCCLIQLVGNAPCCCPKEEEIGLPARRLLLDPFPEDVDFLVFALEEAGSLGRFSISETGSVISLRFSK